MIDEATRPTRAVYPIIVAFAALLAVGWRTPGATPFGVVRYFHVPMLVIIALAPRRMETLRRVSVLATAFVVHSLVLVAFSWFHHVPPVAMQQGVYLAAGLTIAAALRDATEREWRILRWSGPAAVATFAVVFVADARAAGIDPIALYRFAIGTRNLNLIEFGLFPPVFNAQVVGVENSTTLRGQVFAAIFVALLLSTYANTVVRRHGSTYWTAYLVSMALGGAFIVVSLARALQVALVVAVLLPVVRLLLRSRARLPTVVALVAGVGAGAVLLASPVAGFVWERITGDTGSYGERSTALRGSIDSIFGSPLIGTGERGDAVALATGDRTLFSAHNFVIDATVVGGVVAGLLAVVVTALVVQDLWRGAVWYLRDERCFAPVAAAFLAPIAMFSAGSGTLQMPDVFGLALFYGVLTTTTATATTVTKSIPDAAVAPSPRRAVGAGRGP